jgi:glycine cleavage system protein P-like pyridoxal-binding family
MTMHMINSKYNSTYSENFQINDETSEVHPFRKQDDIRNVAVLYDMLADAVDSINSVFSTEVKDEK